MTGTESPGRSLVRHDPTWWFCALVVAVFGVRAVSTLLAGATWTAPGTGWRSVWQLAVVALAVAGLVSARRRWVSVLAIGAVYVVATLLEAVVSGSTLLVAIPVDMRDRLVHPLVAVLAAASLLVVRARRRA